MSKTSSSMSVVPFIAMGVGIAWSLLSIAISVRKRDWMWFGRSGSVLCVVGAILSASALLRVGPTELAKIAGFGYKSYEDPEVDPGKLLEGRLGVAGFSLAALGTLIWGYGDLLGRLFR